jgi:acetoin utilization protein AcuB
MMFVSDWMATKVMSLAPDNTAADALSLMKEKRIHHLPIVTLDKLVGILSDRDLREFIPAKSSTLDVYAVHYLPAKTKLKEIMKTELITTTSDTPLENAAMVMLDRDIGCLPVVDGGKLIGIITDKDIFSALVDITGVRHRGHRVDVTLEDRPGSIRELADIIRKNGFRLRSILTSYEGVKEGFRAVVIRTAGHGNFKGLKDDLEAAYKRVNIRKG